VKGGKKLSMIKKWNEKKKKNTEILIRKSESNCTEREKRKYGGERFFFVFKTKPNKGKRWDQKAKKDEELNESFKTGTTRWRGKGGVHKKRHVGFFMAEHRKNREGAPCWTINGNSLIRRGPLGDEQGADKWRVNMIWKGINRGKSGGRRLREGAGKKGKKTPPLVGTVAKKEVEKQRDGPENSGPIAS